MPVSYTHLFCEAVEAKKRSCMTVVEVAGKGSCIIRKMETKSGDVKIIRSYYVYGDGKMELSSKDTYKAESWEYTEDGYLMFSGELTLKDSYEITRDKMMEYTAYRVLPLDETCRELNRKSVSYTHLSCTSQESTQNMIPLREPSNYITIRYLSQTISKK